MNVSKECVLLLAVVSWMSLGCESENDARPLALPEFQDRDGNGINDYVEAGNHVVSPDDPRWHGFIDADGNGSCDLADPPDPVWHGPGYIDTDGDGICDYWDSDFKGHHQGRRDIVHGADFAEVESRMSHH